MQDLIKIGSKEYLIITQPLTIGERIRMGVVRDRFIEHLGGTPSTSSHAVLDLSAQLAKVFVIVKAGIMPKNFPSSDLGTGTIEILMKMDESVVREILKIYKERSEKPEATTLDEAKKK